MRQENGHSGNVAQCVNVGRALNVRFGFPRHVWCVDTSGTVPSVTPDQTTTLERISLDYVVSVVALPSGPYDCLTLTVESDSSHAPARLTVWPDGLTDMRCQDVSRVRLAVSSVLFALSIRPAAALSPTDVLLAVFGKDVQETSSPDVVRVGVNYIAAATADGRIRVYREGASTSAVTVSADDAVKLFRLFDAVT